MKQIAAELPPLQIMDINQLRALHAQNFGPSRQHLSDDIIRSQLAPVLREMNSQRPISGQQMASRQEPLQFDARNSDLISLRSDEMQQDRSPSALNNRKVRNWQLITDKPEENSSESPRRRQ